MFATRKQLEKIGLKALKKAYQIHEELGVAGEVEVEKNQFGETALKADIEMEKVVIRTLTKAHVPIRVVSEEHGIMNIDKNPVYLGVLDGLDGSGVYKEERGRGRYGTMFGVFSNLVPKYDDYLFSGVMEHSTKKLFYASRGRGSYVVEKRKERPIHSSNNLKLDKQTRIDIDSNEKAKHFDFITKTFVNRLIFNLSFKCYYSSAARYVDLASGKTDLVLECSRKGNLEIAVAYGLVIEAGGVMVTSDGKSLGPRKYLEFGQDGYVPVITASTKQLAQELITYLNRK